jgi:hypothetical protein
MVSKFKKVFSVRYVGSYFSHYSFQITATESNYVNTQLAKKTARSNRNQNSTPHLIRGKRGKFHPSLT